MKKHLALFAALLVASATIAQNNPKLPDVVPPSPTVANLMKFEEVPIDYYSGQANIIIPLFSKQIAQDLGVNMSLNYNTTGVQLTSNYGWTGVGWSLFAGGTISRTVRDVPDETQKGMTNKTGVLHNSQFWEYLTSVPLTQPGAEENWNKFKWKVLGDPSDKYDNLLDLYQFNFMGYSGRFVIIKKLGNLEAKLISRNIPFDISITPKTDGSLVIDSFTIRDAKGYSYVFNVFEVTDSHSSYESISQNTETSDFQGQDSSYLSRTAWHLSEVKDTKGNILITFLYNHGSSEGNSNLTVTTNDVLKVTPKEFNYNIIKRNSYNKSIMKPRLELSQTDMKTNTRKLSAIRFRDSTSVSINVAADDLVSPVGAAKRLQSIVLNDAQGTPYKTLSFTYENTASRMWLTQISETSGGETLATKLHYYNKSNLPTPSVFLENGDDWDYYSGINDQHTPTNPFDVNRIKTGLLTSIEYPTGGVKSFEYEHNSYSHVGNALLSYDQYMKNPLNVVDDVVSVSYTYTNPLPPPGNFPEIPLHNNLLPTQNPSFTLDFEQTIYISSQIDTNPSNTNLNYINEHEIWIQDATGKMYARVDLGTVNNPVSNLPAGDYKFVFASKGSETNIPYDIALNFFRVEFKRSVANPKHEMIGGGVRIKSVSFYDSVSSIAPSKRTHYSYTMEGNPLLSSGVLNGNILRFSRDYTYKNKHYLFHNQDNFAANFYHMTLEYRTKTKGFNVQMTKGGYVGYRGVKVSQAESNGLTTNEDLGHSMYIYTTSYDYPTPIVNFLFFPASAPMPNLDYKKGQLLKQKVYDNSNRLLKEVVNSYQNVEELLYRERTIYKDPMSVYRPFFIHYDFYKSSTADNIPLCLQVGEPGPCFSAYPTPKPGLLSMETDFKLGWSQLKETITRDYYYADAVTPTVNVMESKKTYTYNTNNYQIATETSYIKEKGVDIHYKTSYFYPQGGSLSGGTSASVRSDLIALNKVNEVLETQTTRSEGPPAPNGEEVLNTTFTIYNRIDNDANLVLPTEVKTAKGTGTAESRVKFIKYDAFDNPLEVTQTDGTHIVYLWGYHKTLPIAKIENATWSDVTTAIATLASSYDTLAEIQTLSNNDNDATQGTSGNEGALRTALNALRNASGMANAQITTFTYDPSVGVTSMTDPRDNVMYYEYDAFNRLQYVKNKDGHIVSENQYHYKN